MGAAGGAGGGGGGWGLNSDSDSDFDDGGREGGVGEGEGGMLAPPTNTQLSGHLSPSLVGMIETPALPPRGGPSPRTADTKAVLFDAPPLPPRGDRTAAPPPPTRAGVPTVNLSLAGGGETVDAFAGVPPPPPKAPLPSTYHAMTDHIDML